MPLHKTPAITLKSRRWGEADRIVTFYSLRFGKLGGVARGARRMKSRFGSALEPLVHCDLNLFEKQGDSLYRVTQADIRESFGQIREDLGKMTGAARMANLVSAVTVEGDPDPKMFETLLEGLRALQGRSDVSLTTLMFQIRLLGQTGFRPQMDHCALCGTVSEENLGLFSPRAGGITCSACASRQTSPSLPMSRGSRALFGQASRMVPSGLVRLRATGQVRRELETVVEAFVRVVTGKRLPTVDFLAAEQMDAAYGVTR